MEMKPHSLDLKLHSAVLMVEDFDSMVRFYRDVLLQEPEVDFGNCMAFKCGISIWKMSPDLVRSIIGEPLEDQ